MRGAEPKRAAHGPSRCGLGAGGRARVLCQPAEAFVRQEDFLSCTLPLKTHKNVLSTETQVGTWVREGRTSTVKRVREFGFP